MQSNFEKLRADLKRQKQIKKLESRKKRRFDKRSLDFAQIVDSDVRSHLGHQRKQRRIQSDESSKRKDRWRHSSGNTRNQKDEGELDLQKLITDLAAQRKQEFIEESRFRTSMPTSIAKYFTDASPFKDSLLLSNHESSSSSANQSSEPSVSSKKKNTNKRTQWSFASALSEREEEIKADESEQASKEQKSQTQPTTVLLPSLVPPSHLSESRRKEWWHRTRITLRSRIPPELLLQIGSAPPLGRRNHLPSGRPTKEGMAFDCEMVGVGKDGQKSVLARISIVNIHGQVCYDEFVRAVEDLDQITDYRTHVSGIRPEDLMDEVELRSAETNSEERILTDDHGKVLSKKERRVLQWKKEAEEAEKTGNKKTDDEENEDDDLSVDPLAESALRMLRGQQQNSQNKRNGKEETMTHEGRRVKRYFECLNEVYDLLKGCRILGHSLQNDWKVMSTLKDKLRATFYQTEYGPILKAKQKKKDSEGINNDDEKQSRLLSGFFGKEADEDDDADESGVDSSDLYNNTQLKQQQQKPVPMDQVNLSSKARAIAKVLIPDDSLWEWDSALIGPLHGHSKLTVDLTFDPTRRRPFIRRRALRHLCELFLGIHIQSGSHDSVQDARACVLLYVALKPETEKWCLERRELFAKMKHERSAMRRKSKWRNHQNKRVVKSEHQSHRMESDYSSFVKRGSGFQRRGRGRGRRSAQKRVLKDAVETDFKDLSKLATYGMN